MNRESKKLIYKHADGFSNGETLQSALVRALTQYHRTADRVEPLGADSSEVRFINLTRNHQKMLLGIFHKLTKGAGQYVIEMGDGAEAWNVVIVKAKAEGKPNREFVEGTLFFGLWKNHLILHQSSACRADQFQQYASWLLGRPGTDGQPPTVAPLVSLADPVPPDMRKKTRQPVKTIKFGGALETRTVDQAAKGSSKTRMHFTPTGGLWEGLKMILHELKAKVPEDFRVDDALGAQDLRVEMELSCTKRKAESTAGEVLGILGRSLSHSDAAYTVELADGSKITAREMKVEKTVRVECVEKQPVPEGLFTSMVEWMAELVDSHVVAEEEPFGNIK